MIMAHQGPDAAASASRELVASGSKEAPEAELVSGGYELYLPSSSGQGGGALRA